MQRRGSLRTKLKMMLVSSLRSLAQIVLQGWEASISPKKCLSSSPRLSQRNRRVSGQTHTTCGSVFLIFLRQFADFILSP